MSKIKDIIIKNLSAEGIHPEALTPLTNRLMPAVTPLLSKRMALPNLSVYPVISMIRGAQDAGYQAWKFILELANIYSCGFIIMVLFVASTDQYLTNEIWAHLNRPNIFGKPVGRKRTKRGNGDST